MRCGKSIVVIVVLLISMAQLAQAAPPRLEAKQAVLVDSATGTVLLAKDADVAVPPSSMSKLMTIYILFDRLKSGVLTLDDTFRVSKKAWAKKGSKMFVPYNGKVRVEDLIRGIVVQSGNDACIVVAEGIAGDERSFADEMNRVAKDMGLEHSYFVNATGWPDDEHVMSMRDLVTLSERLIKDFPEYYHYFSEAVFSYNDIKQYNRNTLLDDDPSVDGLKTGHTEVAGYGIVVSAKRKDRRLTLAVNGLDSQRARIVEAEKLLNYGFRHFENNTLVTKGQIVETAEIWFGAEEQVALVAAEDVMVTIPKRWKHNNVKMMVRYQGPIPAPIQQGDHIADLVIEADNIETTKVPLYAGATVESLSSWGHMMRVLRYYGMGY